MAYLFPFIISVVCARINLPGAMGGNPASIAALAFCLAIGIWELAMASIAMLR